MSRARLTFLVALCAACSRVHGTSEPPDGGRDAAQEANEIADNLELAYPRYFACRGTLPEDRDVWDGSSRECFVAFITKHLERRDEFAACIRDAALAFSQCGEETPCSSSPCVSATLLDDNPVDELVTDTCGSHLDAESRYTFRVCR